MASWNEGRRTGGRFCGNTGGQTLSWEHGQASMLTLLSERRQADGRTLLLKHVRAGRFRGNVGRARGRADAFLGTWAGGRAYALAGTRAGGRADTCVETRAGARAIVLLLHTLTICSLC